MTTVDWSGNRMRIQNPKSVREDQTRERVREHTRRAWILSCLEKKPPGYNQVLWASFLMDIPSERLRRRFNKRMNVEIATFEEREDRAFPLDSLDTYLPAVPARFPAELNTKMRQLMAGWLGEGPQGQCLP